MKPKPDAPAKGRRNVPLFIILPPAERERLTTFAGSIARPFSWVVRDALRVYLDAVEGNAGKIAALRADLAAPDVDLGNAGRTVAAPRGRPRKRKVYVR